MREHIGGIYDFLAKKNIATLGELQKNSTAPRPVSTKKDTQSEGRLAYEQQKEIAKRRRKLERAAEDAEKEVSQIEAAVRLLEDQMSASNGAQDASLFSKHASLSKQLEKAMEEWETAESALEDFNAQQQD